MSESGHLYIRMTGSARERGRIHGEAASERIRRCLAEYRDIFSNETGVSWEEARAVAAGFEPEIRALRPDLIEEMQGIAEGAELPYEDILTLNCRSEVMFASASNSCTVVAATPEVSGDGKTYLGQNWDWRESGYGTTVVLDIDQPPMPRVLITTEAGFVGGKGMNELGVAQTMNALSVNKAKKGVPLQVLLRHTLSQTTLPRAVNAIVKANRAGSACIGLASPDGLAVMVETAPCSLDVLTGYGKPLCHTNHWLSPVMQSGPEARNYTFISSFTRLDRAIRLSAAKAGHLRKDELFEIFRDHAGFPDCICQHGTEGLPLYAQHSSVWSVVFDTNEKVMWLTDRKACEGEAKPYAFK